MEIPSWNIIWIDLFSGLVIHGFDSVVGLTGRFPFPGSFETGFFEAFIFVEFYVKILQSWKIKILSWTSSNFVLLFEFFAHRSFHICKVQIED